MALRAAIAVLQTQKDKSKRDMQTLQQLKEAAAKDPEGFAEHLAAGKLNYDRDPGFGPLQATFEGGDDDDDDDDGSETAETAASPKFPKIPTAQDVFRCPPVNWSKYHIVGEPLDRMHEEQRLRPAPGELSRERAPEHVIAAPYSPFDSEQQPMQTRRGSKRPP